LALKWVFRINLGSYVLYKGKKHMVMNGDITNQWRLDGIEDCRGYVPRCDCSKIWNLQEIYHSFRSGYNFYMTNWYRIWVNEGIQGWMKGVL
jgi:hypothetical protein